MLLIVRRDGEAVRLPLKNIRKPDFWKTSKVPRLVARCALCLKRRARVSPQASRQGKLPWRWPRSHDFPGVGAFALLTEKRPREARLRGSRSSAPIFAAHRASEQGQRANPAVISLEN
jgi:hypothetical protein